MKSYFKELSYTLPTRRAFGNITPEVEESLQESGVQEGLLLCNAMQITASVFINDEEAGLHHDYDEWLERLAPHALLNSTSTMDTRIMPTLIWSVRSWAERLLWQ